MFGFFNWFRPFIYNISKLLIPLSDKLKKENKFKWTNDDTLIKNKVFNEIKRKTLLYHPDVNQDFKLITDASDRTIGSILIQENKLIGLFSHKLNVTEERYTVMEKEALAVIKSLQHFKNIIYNSKITVMTDNKNLTYLTEFNNKRVKRLKLSMADSIYVLNLSMVLRT
ncbi:Transposon Tf2-9 polyprotein [Dictyocoela muelleri]|nr:Transposon Tf2-9 polyprotein [Dictyocoela muelleri]